MRAYSRNTRHLMRWHLRLLRWLRQEDRQLAVEILLPVVVAVVLALLLPAVGHGQAGTRTWVAMQGTVRCASGRLPGSIAAGGSWSDVRAGGYYYLTVPGGSLVAVYVDGRYVGSVRTGSQPLRRSWRVGGC